MLKYDIRKIFVKYYFVKKKLVKKNICMIFLLISNVFINDGDVFGIYVFFVLIGCYVCV